MTGLTLTTPSLLFSAISLILLAYTNRFLSYASVVRNLKDKYDSNPQSDPSSLRQIRNLVKRLQLIRAMQILGAGSLLFCITAMFFIYIEYPLLADWIFGSGMVMLAASLCICIWEIQISVQALEVNLETIKERQRDREPFVVIRKHDKAQMRGGKFEERKGQKDKEQAGRAKRKQQGEEKPQRNEEKSQRGEEYKPQVEDKSQLGEVRRGRNEDNSQQGREQRQESRTNATKRGREVRSDQENLSQVVSSTERKEGQRGVRPVRQPRREPRHEGEDTRQRNDQMANAVSEVSTQGTSAPKVEASVTPRAQNEVVKVNRPDSKAENASPRTQSEVVKVERSESKVEQSVPRVQNEIIKVDRPEIRAEQSASAGSTNE